MDLINELYKDNGISKALVLFDLHVPFHREETILDTVRKHKDEIDTIIFGGDIMDCEGITTFPKEVRKPLVEEMVILYKLLRKIDKLTPNAKKILIWGNHEFRFVRELAKNKNSLNVLHSDNILQEIVSGFERYDRWNRRRFIYPPLSDNFVVTPDWYYQHNDVIIAHPKNFSKVNLRTATNAVEHFLKRGFEFNGCFIGHTHKWGYTQHYGKYCGEVGCLCWNMDYSNQGNLNYSPQDYGYIVLAFREGILDFNFSYKPKLELEEGDFNWEDVEEDLS